MVHVGSFVLLDEQQGAGRRTLTWLNPGEVIEINDRPTGLVERMSFRRGQ
jgi:hypothetical protein